MLAAREGNDEMVRMLLEARANQESKNEDGETALDKARQNSHMRVVKMLERWPLPVANHSDFV